MVATVIIIIAISGPIAAMRSENIRAPGQALLHLAGLWMRMQVSVFQLGHSRSRPR